MLPPPGRWLKLSVLRTCPPSENELSHMMADVDWAFAAPAGLLMSVMRNRSTPSRRGCATAVRPSDMVKEADFPRFLHKPRLSLLTSPPAAFGFESSDWALAPFAKVSPKTVAKSCGVLN